MCVCSLTVCVYSGRRCMTKAELYTQAIRHNYPMIIFLVCVSLSICSRLVLSCVSGRRRSSTASKYWNHLCKSVIYSFSPNTHIPHTHTHTHTHTTHPTHTHSRHYGPIHPVSVSRLRIIGKLRLYLGTPDQLTLAQDDLTKASPPLYSCVLPPPPHTHTAG